MSYKKIILLVSFLIVFGFLFNFNTPVAEAMTTMEIQALIQQLQSQIAQLQSQLAEVTGGEKVWCHDFNRNLKYGNAGEEVRALQTALQKEGFYKRTITGDFDEYTASAVVGFQEKYKEDVLVPWGLEHGTDYVGPTTRAKLNKLYGCSKPSITVLSPNGGETWIVGNTYNITWNASGIDKVNIYLEEIELPGGIQPKIACSSLPCDSNVSFCPPCDKAIAKNISASLGKYSWTIPANQQVLTKAKIAIYSVSAGKIYDESDNYFSIVAAPSITVLSPNGGEKWVVGKTYEITWRSSGIDKVDVSLCGQIPIDIAGNCLPVIAEDISANLGKYSWTIPSDISPKDGYRIRIFDGKTNLQDDTDNYFSIVAKADDP
ncbi:MAG: hypothetical protein CO031_03015, partial [Candidatus Nealsonbacteria bacterium CG_4_9_14_0_2_um_filter_37_38]